jgi:hypothetical protein
VKRSLLVGLVLLSACARVQPSLTWVEPTPGAVVVGQVQLSVQAVGESPANVVFYLGDQPVVKAYALEEGRFSGIWDSASVSPGVHTLSAKPYGGAPVSIQVTVVQTRSRE